MKRLYIIVEGQTEDEFIKQIIRPYFNNLSIYNIYPIIIHTSKGHKGDFINYQHLKNDIITLLKNQDDIVVSTFVDYFRIPTDIPGFDDCIKINTDVQKKIDCLEDLMKNDINDHRFIPYIQKHEFESLLFSANSGFIKYYDNEVFDKTQEIIDKYNSPEEINDGPDTAPSKRIKKIIKNYDKVVEGNLIAIEIGIEKILERCNKFNLWINNLIKAIN